MFKILLLFLLVLPALAQESVDMVSDPEQQMEQTEWQTQEYSPDVIQPVQEEIREPASDVPVEEPIYD